ncbi:MAG: VWA domain-containing protein [Pyrinomonadaceae bacterium]
MRLSDAKLNRNPFAFPRLASCHSLLLVCAFATLLARYPITSVAQDPPADDEVIRVSTELLLFPIRVRDKRAQQAKLTEDDLTLKDEDRVTTGIYFSAGADRLALVFALDQSGSLREIIAQQREAALALFGRFGEKSRVAVLRFSERPILAAEFGRDTDSARDAFIFPAGRNRRTAIFDAAATAVRTFESLPRVRSERRIVILISDGLDNASATKADEAIKTAVEQNVSIYVIHLPLFEPRDGRLAVRSPAKGFRDLAEKTGGKYFLAGDPRSALETTSNPDLTPVFATIEADLRSQYLLGFYIGAAAHDGRKHRLSLSLPAGVEYQVGARGFSRKQEFFVERPREAFKKP